MSRIQIPNTNYRGPQYYTEHGSDEWVGNEDWITIGTGAFNTVVERAPLTKPFSFGAGANYTEFGSFNGGSGAKRIAAGIKETERTLGYYHVTRTGNLQKAKVYQGSHTNDFSFDFRVFENGTFNSFFPFMYFVAATYPMMDENQLQELVNKMNAQVGNTGVSGFLKNMVMGSLGNLAQTVGNMWASLNAEDLSEAVKEGVTFESLSDYFAAMNGLDRTFNVNVGNLIHLKNMVLTSFNATFSRERRWFYNEQNEPHTLPIYVDYTIQISPIIEPTRQDVLSWFDQRGRGNYCIVLADKTPKFNDDEKERNKWIAQNYKGEKLNEAPKLESTTNSSVLFDEFGNTK